MDTFRKLFERQVEKSRLASFHHLMRNRVRGILLVSSAYDAFMLSEEGRIQEKILSEYLDHNLSSAPDLTRVSNGEEALDLAHQTERYSLIITTAHLEDLHVLDLAFRLRQGGVDTPLVLLVYDERELARLDPDRLASLNVRPFLWQGDFRLMLAIVKWAEDRLNIDADTAAIGVQTIILVEDSVRFYSAYLPLIYTELMHQSQSLLNEGLNLSDRLLRMRARPKIVLCSTFEEAWEQYRRYEQTVLGIISDIRFPRAGRLDPAAGLELCRRVRTEHADIPVLLQSSDPDGAEAARAAGASFSWKYSPTLLHELRGFMHEQFAFGDFVFRGSDGREVGRAGDLRSLEEQIGRIPDESLLYHSSRNHFSRWLKARTEFRLAHDLRYRTAEEFPTPGELRRFLAGRLHEFRINRYRGIVVDFDPDDFETKDNIARIGGGSVGGKARGLAFVSHSLIRFGIRDAFDGIKVFVPASVVVCTDVFDQFIEENRLAGYALAEDDDARLHARFQGARFPEQATRELRSFLAAVTHPLAVRSSSLLEDSQYQPFAGVYETIMTPNNHGDLEVRLERLLAAIRRVYASTYASRAREYMRATTYRQEEEKMAVVIQRLMGRTHGNRFYPDFAGVMRSHNCYPMPPMTAADGIATVALGFGKAVVDGGKSISFCPRHPGLVAQLSTVHDILTYSQRSFFALDLAAAAGADGAAALLELPVEAAEADGTLAAVGSTWVAEDQALHDGTSRRGARVVSFAPVLKHGLFPLARILNVASAMGTWGMNTPVEIEFAVDLAPAAGPRQFGILQIRPLPLQRDWNELETGPTPAGRVVCRSPKVLGNGVIDTIRDVVAVDPERFDRGRSREAAADLARFNRELLAEETPYLLIALGRLGSADPWLGIPVTWSQISGARAIVETGFRDFRVTASQGSHFFQNLTSFRVGYFTVNEEQSEGEIDWTWLLAQPAFALSGSVRRIRLPRPLLIRMNGRTGGGEIVVPETDPT